MSAAAIALVIVVVAALVLAGTAAMAARRRLLKRRFGPEYDRVVVEKRGHLRAAAELARRARRVQRLGIRPLTAAARARYAGQWPGIQQRFVDSPERAVVEAELLVLSVMRERGYPAEDHDQVASDLSVTNAATLDHYRAARQISADAERGDASTEHLRQAFIHFRWVFGDLLGRPDGAMPGVTDAAEPRPAEVVPPQPAIAGTAEPDQQEGPEPVAQLWRPAVRVPPPRTSAEQETAR